MKKLFKQFKTFLKNVFPKLAEHHAYYNAVNLSATDLLLRQILSLTAFSGMVNISVYNNLKYLIDCIKAKGFADRWDIMRFVEEGLPIEIEIAKIQKINRGLLMYNLKHNNHLIKADQFCLALANLINEGGPFYVAKK